MLTLHQFTQGSKQGLSVLPAFLLSDENGDSQSFPGDKAALICLLKEDCPTCNDVMPVLESFYRAFGDRVDFFVAGQTEEGNALLRKRYSPSFHILDDTSLKVSFAYDIDTVPSLFLSDKQGNLDTQLIGFVRDEWQQLAKDMVTKVG